MFIKSLNSYVFKPHLRKSLVLNFAFSQYSSYIGDINTGLHKKSKIQKRLILMFPNRFNFLFFIRFHVVLNSRLSCYTSNDIYVYRRKTIIKKIINKFYVQYKSIYTQ